MHMAVVRFLVGKISDVIGLVGAKLSKVLSNLYTVNPPYNDMVFAAKRIVIKGVSLYLILVCKMHPKSKLGNNIISTPTKW